MIFVFVMNVSFLVVSLDNKLTFGRHVRSILSEVSKSEGLLYKIRNFLTPKFDWISIVPTVSCHRSGGCQRLDVYGYDDAVTTDHLLAV